jgi:NTP pyrophosphatase (non-canonical NTP hydrolase)
VAVTLMPADPLAQLKLRLRDFATARDWDQFHSPKNLSMALIAEAAELLEHFQWLTQDQSANLPQAKLKEVEHELADILIYLIRIADKLDIDLHQAAQTKIDLNEKKYPATTVKGSARKYTEYRVAPSAAGVGSDFPPTDAGASRTLPGEPGSDPGNEASSVAKKEPTP